MQLTDKRPIQEKGAYDVVVVGGGIAGVAAAVAAAREGAKTLLLEKSVVLGGLATAGLINWYEPLCDSAGRKMIGGIPEELIRLSVRYGFHNLPVEWAEGVTTTDPPKRMASSFSPTIFAVAMDEYLRENGVELVLDCLAVWPLMRETVCQGIVAEVKEGRAFYAAQAVVDATGDAGIFHSAGAPTVEGKNYLTYVSHGVTDRAVDAYQKNHTMLSLRKWFAVGSDMFGNGNPEDAGDYAGTDSGGNHPFRPLRAGACCLIKSRARTQTNAILPCCLSCPSCAPCAGSWARRISQPCRGKPAKRPWAAAVISARTARASTTTSRSARCIMRNFPTCWRARAP